MSDLSVHEERGENQVPRSESNSPQTKRRKQEIFGSDEGIVEKTLKGELSRCANLVFAKRPGLFVTWFCTMVS